MYMYKNQILAECYGYFKFDKKKYLHGTVVKFNRQWLIDNGHPLCGEVQNGDNPLHTIPCGESLYGKFENNKYNSKCCFSRWPTVNYQEYAYTSFKDIILSPEDLGNVIEEISVPVELVKNPSKKWNEVPEVKKMLVIYIILMFASLIFTEPWGCWIGLTILFLGLSQKAIDHASGNDGPWWND